MKKQTINSENTALAWSSSVKEAALYFDNVIPLDREYTWDNELFQIIPDSMRGDYEGIKKELWDIYLAELELRREKYFNKNNPELCDRYIKQYQIYLNLFEQKYNISKYPVFGEYLHDDVNLYSTIEMENVPFYALSDIKMVHIEKLSMEQVLEFRKDKESFQKIRNLRLFLRNNYSGKEKNYILDDLNSKIFEYQKVTKKWGMDTAKGLLGIFLNSQTIRASVTASVALVCFGQKNISAIPATTGMIFECGNLLLEYRKIRKKKELLKRDNPFNYLLEMQNDDLPK